MIYRLWLLCIALCASLPPVAAFAGQIGMAEVQAFMQEMKSEKIFLAQRAPLFNHYYRSEKILPTAVIFLPGMGESALKYYDLGRDLKDLPATVYMWDHIGQGLSSHLLPAEINKIYIDSFETHLLALENFFTFLRKTHKTIYVIGHSMGGHLALRLALRHPDWIQELALTSPLVDLNYDSLPIQHITWLLEYLPGESYPPLYFLFQSGKKRGNYVTKSEERVKVMEEVFKKYPEQRREGTTIGWLRAALHSISELKKANPTSLMMPVLILQAEKDFLVSNSAQSELCQKIPHCQTKTIPDSYHEILFEKDPARKTALEAIEHFFKWDRVKKPTQLHPAGA